MRLEGFTELSLDPGAVQSKVVPHDAVCVTGRQEWLWLTGGEFPQAKAHLFLTTPICRTLEEIVF